MDKIIHVSFFFFSIFLMIRYMNFYIYGYFQKKSIKKVSLMYTVALYLSGTSMICLVNLIFLGKVLGIEFIIFLPAVFIDFLYKSGYYSFLAFSLRTPSEKS